MWLGAAAGPRRPAANAAGPPDTSEPEPGEDHSAITGALGVLCFWVLSRVQTHGLMLFIIQALCLVGYFCFWSSCSSASTATLLINIVISVLLCTGEPGSLSVPRAYAGATVLLTGGSGFVGGLCLAALLRDCPELRRVYVLLRPDARRGLDARARLQRLLDGPIFAGLWCAAVPSLGRSVVCTHRSGCCSLLMYRILAALMQVQCEH